MVGARRANGFCTTPQVQTTEGIDDAVWWQPQEAKWMQSGGTMTTTTTTSGDLVVVEAKHRLSRLRRWVGRWWSNTDILNTDNIYYKRTDIDTKKVHARRQNAG